VLTFFLHLLAPAPAPAPPPLLRVAGLLLEGEQVALPVGKGAGFHAAPGDVVELECLLVRRLGNYGRRFAHAPGLRPPHGAQAPLIPRAQSWEASSPRGEIVAHGLGIVEEFLGHLGADDVSPAVVWPRLTRPVPIPPCHGACRADDPFQRRPIDILIGNDSVSVSVVAVVDDGPPFLIYRGAIRSRRRYRRQERGPEGDYRNCDGFHVFAKSAFFFCKFGKKNI